MLFSLQLPDEAWPRWFIVQRGRAAPLPAFAGTPRWSPDGTRFVAQATASTERPGPTLVYDTASGAGEYLPVVGRPDWFPDGRRLVYVAGDIFTYDLASTTSTQVSNLPTDGDDGWGIPEAHVLPDEKHIFSLALDVNWLAPVATGCNGGQFW